MSAQKGADPRTVKSKPQSKKGSFKSGETKCSRGNSFRLLPRGLSFQFFEFFIFIIYILLFSVRTPCIVLSCHSFLSLCTREHDAERTGALSLKPSRNSVDQSSVRFVASVGMDWHQQRVRSCVPARLGSPNEFCEQHTTHTSHFLTFSH